MDGWIHTGKLAVAPTVRDPGRRVPAGRFRWHRPRILAGAGGSTVAGRLAAVVHRRGSGFLPAPGTGRLRPRRTAGRLAARGRGERAGRGSVVEVSRGAGGREFLDRVRDALGDGFVRHPAGDGFMSWEMAREMAAAGIVFGAHGVSHRLMSQLSDEEQEAEAMGSRRADRGATGVHTESVLLSQWRLGLSGGSPGAGLLHHELPCQMGRLRRSRQRHRRLAQHENRRQDRPRGRRRHEFGCAQPRQHHRSHRPLVQRQRFRMPELAWQQSLRNGELVMVAGMVNQGDYFDANSYANSGHGQFLNWP